MFVLSLLAVLSSPAEAKTPEKPSLSPVEIASFQLSQTYSLLGPLSRKTDCSDILGVPVCQETQTSHLSSVDGQFHYNPTLFASVDLRAQYDILYRAAFFLNLKYMDLWCVL